MEAQSDDLAQEQYAGKEIKTIRLRLRDKPGSLAQALTAIGECGGLLGDIRKIRVTSYDVSRDVSVYVRDMAHFAEIVNRLRELPGVEVVQTRDEVVLLHEGGKTAMRSKVPLDSLTNLRMVYTPGVAQICKAIQAQPNLLGRLTSAGNTVAIVTNGTAVLGLGNIGIGPAMPVMEGKAVLLMEMAGVNAIPILLDSDDAEEIATTVEKIASTFGLIQLEDIRAPLCFEVEQKLTERLSIPVFHDDQHGTACVVLSALIRAFEVTSRRKEDARVVVNGAGAAGIAIAKLLGDFGVGDLIVADRAGAIYRGRTEHMNPFKAAIAERTNREKVRGGLDTILPGADVFIGVSSPGVLSMQHVRSMAKNSIVFALANPVPEIRARDAQEAGAAIAADGRTINNALAFPGIFRGALNSRARRINTEMIQAAAWSLASQCKPNDLVPDFLRRETHIEVARAVSAAAEKTGVARPEPEIAWLHGDEQAR